MRSRDMGKPTGNVRPVSSPRRSPLNWLGRYSRTASAGRYSRLPRLLMRQYRASPTVSSPYCRTITELLFSMVRAMAISSRSWSSSSSVAAASAGSAGACSTPSPVPDGEASDDADPGSALVGSRLSGSPFPLGFSAGFSAGFPPGFPMVLTPFFTAGSAPASAGPSWWYTIAGSPTTLPYTPGTISSRARRGNSTPCGHSSEGRR